MKERMDVEEAASREVIVDSEAIERAVVYSSAQRRLQVLHAQVQVYTDIQSREARTREALIEAEHAARLIQETFCVNTLPDTYTPLTAQQLECKEQIERHRILLLEFTEHRNKQAVLHRQLRDIQLRYPQYQLPLNKHVKLQDLDDIDPACILEEEYASRTYLQWEENSTRLQWETHIREGIVNLLKFHPLTPTSVVSPQFGPVIGLRPVSAADRSPHTSPSAPARAPTDQHNHPVHYQQHQPNNSTRAQQLPNTEPSAVGVHRQLQEVKKRHPLSTPIRDKRRREMQELDARVATNTATTAEDRRDNGPPQQVDRSVVTPNLVTPLHDNVQTSVTKQMVHSMRIREHIMFKVATMTERTKADQHRWEQRTQTHEAIQEHRRQEVALENARIKLEATKLRQDEARRIQVAMAQIGQQLQHYQPVPTQAPYLDIGPGNSQLHVTTPPQHISPTNSRQHTPTSGYPYEEAQQQQALQGEEEQVSSKIPVIPTDWRGITDQDTQHPEWQHTNQRSPYTGYPPTGYPTNQRTEQHIEYFGDQPTQSVRELLTEHFQDPREYSLTHNANKPNLSHSPTQDDPTEPWVPAGIIPYQHLALLTDYQHQPTDPRHHPTNYHHLTDHPTDYQQPSDHHHLADYQPQPTDHQHHPTDRQHHPTDYHHLADYPHQLSSDWQATNEGSHQEEDDANVTWYDTPYGTTIDTAPYYTNDAVLYHQPYPKVARVPPHQRGAIAAPVDKQWDSTTYQVPQTDAEQHLYRPPPRSAESPAIHQPFNIQLDPTGQPHIAVSSLLHTQTTYHLEAAAKDLLDDPYAIKAKAPPLPVGEPADYIPPAKPPVTPPDLERHKGKDRMALEVLMKSTDKDEEKNRRAIVNAELEARENLLKKAFTRHPVVGLGKTINFTPKPSANKQEEEIVLLQVDECRERRKIVIQNDLFWDVLPQRFTGEKHRIGVKPDSVTPIAAAVLPTQQPKTAEKNIEPDADSNPDIHQLHTLHSGHDEAIIHQQHPDAPPQRTAIHTTAQQRADGGLSLHELQSEETNARNKTYYTETVGREYILGLVYSARREVGSALVHKPQSHKATPHRLPPHNRSASTMAPDALNSVIADSLWNSERIARLEVVEAEKQDKHTLFGQHTSTGPQAWLMDEEESARLKVLEEESTSRKYIADGSSEVLTIVHRNYTQVKQFEENEGWRRLDITRVEKLEFQEIVQYVTPTIINTRMSAIIRLLTNKDAPLKDMTTKLTPEVQHLLTVKPELIPTFEVHGWNADAEEFKETLAHSTCAALVDALTNYVQTVHRDAIVAPDIMHPTPVGLQTAAHVMNAITYNRKKRNKLVQLAHQIALICVDQQDTQPRYRLAPLVQQYVELYPEAELLLQKYGWSPTESRFVYMLTNPQRLAIMQLVSTTVDDTEQAHNNVKQLLEKIQLSLHSSSDKFLVSNCIAPMIQDVMDTYPESKPLFSAYHYDESTASFLQPLTDSAAAQLTADITMVFGGLNMSNSTFTESMSTTRSSSPKATIPIAHKREDSSTFFHIDASDLDNEEAQNRIHIVKERHSEWNDMIVYIGEQLLVILNPDARLPFDFADEVEYLIADLKLGVTRIESTEEQERSQLVITMEECFISLTSPRDNPTTLSTASPASHHLVQAATSEVAMKPHHLNNNHINTSTTNPTANSNPNRNPKRAQRTFSNSNPNPSGYSTTNYPYQHQQRQQLQQQPQQQQQHQLQHQQLQQQQQQHQLQQFQPQRQPERRHQHQRQALYPHQHQPQTQFGGGTYVSANFNATYPLAAEAQRASITSTTATPEAHQMVDHYKQYPYDYPLSAAQHEQHEQQEQMMYNDVEIVLPPIRTGKQAWLHRQQQQNGPLQQQLLHQLAQHDIHHKSQFTPNTSIHQPRRATTQHRIPQMQHQTVSLKSISNHKPLSSLIQNPATVSVTARRPRQSLGVDNAANQQLQRETPLGVYKAVADQVGRPATQV